MWEVADDLEKKHLYLEIWRWRKQVRCKTTFCKKQKLSGFKGGRENDYLHSGGRLQRQMSRSKCHNGCEKMNVHWKGQMCLNKAMNAVFDATLPAWTSVKVDMYCHPVFILGTARYFYAWIHGEKDDKKRASCKREKNSGGLNAEVLTCFCWCWH